MAVIASIPRMPYFSIITCTCNAGKTLASCIESVENQLCDDFEHLFIDGFSTDETVSIILKYQARCPGKVRLYQLEPTGVTRAMNEGIAVHREQNPAKGIFFDPRNANDLVEKMAALSASLESSADNSEGSGFAGSYRRRRMAFASGYQEIVLKLFPGRR